MEATLILDWRIMISVAAIPVLIYGALGQLTISGSEQRLAISIVIQQLLMLSSCAYVWATWPSEDDFGAIGLPYMWGAIGFAGVVPVIVLHLICDRYAK